MNMRWRKMAADLHAYRAQITLIVIVLVLGAAGVVAALDAQAVLRRETAQSFQSAAAPDIVLWFDRIDAELLAGVAAQEGVAAVAVRRSLLTRLALPDGRWLPLRLFILPQVLSNVGRTSVGPLHSHAHEAAVAADDAGLWIEQSGATILQARPGQPLRLRGPGGAVVSVPLAGWVHDAAVAPSTQDRFFYGYATPAVAAALTPVTTPDQLLVKMAQRASREDAVALSQELAAYTTKLGRSRPRIEVMPAAHPHAPLMNAALRVLGVLAAMAFCCSAALAAYMVSLWMKREVRIVGILKTLGATRGQVALQYAALVLPLLLVACLLALPLGAWLGRALVTQQQLTMNIDIASWAVPASLRKLEVATLLLLPLLAMALPIWRAAGTTPRQAIQDPGLSPASGKARRWHTWLLRWPGRLRATLALRNSFRRPGRLTLIVLALACGGALLLTTHSNYESLMQVIDHSLAQQGHDIEVILQRPAAAAELEAIAQRVPDVAIAEAWRRSGASLGGQAGTSLAVTAVPAQSRLFKLPVLQGRALRTDASDEVLMTRTMQELDPSLRVGSRLELRHRERGSTVQVVGMVEEIGQPMLYTTMAGFEAITVLGDASTVLRIKAAGPELEPVLAALDQALIDARHTPSQLLSRAVFRDALDEHFKVVGDVIQVVALAVALVGAIVLAASTSLNVLERTREIGVLRAIGATPRSILAIFVGEGLAVALLGMLLALALSIAMTLGLNHAASVSLLHVAVPLRFSFHGLALLGLGLVVLMLAVGLAVMAVLRQPAREALAYE